jgi:hypothetical protein
MSHDHGYTDMTMETVNISTFKATCLARLDRVKRTGASHPTTRSPRGGGPGPRGRDVLKGRSELDSFARLVAVQDV